MTTAPVRILVVDDEPPIRKLLRMGLGAHGYDVLDAPNGKSALELLEKKPSLVILDLGLPDIDGLELLRQIRSRQAICPLLFCRAGEMKRARSLRSISAPTTM